MATFVEGISFILFLELLLGRVTVLNVSLSFCVPLLADCGQILGECGLEFHMIIKITPVMCS